jgi:hypothetical protein
MRVLYSFEEALAYSRPYIEERPKMYYQTDYDRVKRFTEDELPPEAKLPIWKMTTEALENTLRYVFKKLHHNCYLLCVKDNKPLMYKLESLTTAPTFKKAIEDGVSKLDENQQIDESQRKYIRKMVSEPVRVMQCIVKKYKSHDGDVPLEENEYMELFEKMFLPDGVYLLNLTDAIILHSGDKEPFKMVTGNRMLEPEYRAKSHIPILSMSGQKKFSDIPIPNYDDVLFAMGKRADLKTDQFFVDWDKKTIQKAVFRGGSTGCGYTTETNMRIKLADMESPLIDAALTSKGRTIDTMSVKFDPKYGIGMMNTKIRSASKFMSMIDQSKYKYIIHVDGNVNAYRLLTTMLTGSLILRVDSPYTSWVDHLIKPNKHYIMVRPDLSDLVEKIQWCMRHDTKSSQIAKNGYEFAKKTLQTDYIKSAIENILWKVSPLPPKPRSPIESPSWSNPGSPLESPPESSSLDEAKVKAPEKEPEVKIPETKVKAKAPETKAKVKIPEKESKAKSELSKEDVEQVIWSDEEKESKSSSSSSSSLEKAKKCPKGYRSQLVTDKSDPDYGKKVCKQKTQKKAVDKGSVIDMPENAKKCPVGYVSFVDKADGKKKCRRKTQKKE